MAPPAAVAAACAPLLANVEAVLLLHQDKNLFLVIIQRECRPKQTNTVKKFNFIAESPCFYKATCLPSLSTENIGKISL